MKKTYNAPKLTVHGTVEVLTQQVKELGLDDGLSVTINSQGDTISIGS